MRSANHIVLHLKVLDQKFDRLIPIRLDPPYSRRRHDDNGRFLLGKEPVHFRFIHQIQLCTIPCHHILETLPRQSAHERAANQASMTGDEYFYGLLHKWMFALYLFCF
jgi:hypothetical protein